MLEDRTLLSPASPVLSGIHKIQHIIVIMQENRSFDSYFGTFPGADGIPMQNGKPTVSVYDPVTKSYVRPFHDAADQSVDGPHMGRNAVADINGGQMDGFIRQALTDPRLQSDYRRVMGYHDYREIPNYWAYARNFVLQDHMFAPNLGWSLPSHQYLVSGWSGSLKRPFDWTDLTYLLHKYQISWAYYHEGPITQIVDPEEYNATPAIWNPLAYFTDVHEDRQLGNIQGASDYFKAAAAGTLPALSWIVPNAKDSEHPNALISDGQAWATRVINAAMRGPDWNSTAIFMSWDEWGGFYDHVVPPKIDQNGYGLRVPGLVISPYAKQGYIDQQTLSFDAYLKFIEDDFMGGARIDPKTDGRPDQRPTVREDVPQLGDLQNDFDFTQAPRPAFLLPLDPDRYPAPTSQVSLLPRKSSDEFTVSWVGSNSIYQAGIATYDVYVSTDGQAYKPWIRATTQTSATFDGEPNHVYRFVSMATDDLGIRQFWASKAQASTRTIADVNSPHQTPNPEQQEVETASHPDSVSVVSITGATNRDSGALNNLALKKAASVDEGSSFVAFLPLTADAPNDLLGSSLPVVTGRLLNTGVAQLTPLGAGSLSTLGSVAEKLLRDNSRVMPDSGIDGSDDDDGILPDQDHSDDQVPEWVAGIRPTTPPTEGTGESSRESRSSLLWQSALDAHFADEFGSRAVDAWFGNDQTMVVPTNQTRPITLVAVEDTKHMCESAAVPASLVAVLYGCYLPAAAERRRPGRLVPHRSSLIRK